jgi:hypothetical protein
MESDASEFPVIQAPSNSAQSASNNALIFAFHCCQTPRCNGNQSGPAEGSVKSAQAVLIAALKTYLALTVEPSTENERNVTARKEITEKLVAKYGLTSTQLDKDLVVEGPSMIALGEPKSPSALKSETSDNAEIGSTTPAALAAPAAPATIATPAAIVALAEPAAIVAPAEPAAIVAPAEPAAMQPILPDAELVQQELPQNATVGNLEHVVVKRHDNQRGT